MKKLLLIALVALVSINLKAQNIEDAGGNETPIYHLNDNVGIGTNNPTKGKLEIEGDFTDGSCLILNNTGDVTNDVEIRSYSNDIEIGRIATITADNVNSTMRFYTKKEGTFSERMRIWKNGNVGIGVKSPASKLHILQDVEDFNGGIKLVGSLSPISGRLWMGDEKLHMDNATAGTGTGFTLSKTGMIGVGNDSPGYLLDIKAQNTNSDIFRLSHPVASDEAGFMIGFGKNPIIVGGFLGCIYRFYGRPLFVRHPDGDLWIATLQKPHHHGIRRFI